MKKFIILWFILLVAFASLSFAGSKDVLRSLEKIKGGVEAGITLHEYSNLIADAKVEINLLKRSDFDNQQFMNATKKCLTSYMFSRDMWDFKIKFENMRSYTNAAECDDNMQEGWQKASKYLDMAYDSLN